MANLQSIVGGVLLTTAVASVGATIYSKPISERFVLPHLDVTQDYIHMVQTDVYAAHVHGSINDREYAEQWSGPIEDTFREISGNNTMEIYQQNPQRYGEIVDARSAFEAAEQYTQLGVAVGFGLCSVMSFFGGILLLRPRH